MKTFTYFFAVQFVIYGLTCWNIRAVAQGKYVNIALSDLFIAAATFTVIKKVSEAKSELARAGYVAGGVAGSVCSVWLTRTFLGV